ncbi:motility associated factor glycosyltransferase family protein [Anaerosporobacter sp.]|uniref:motility associated factor glycosyltransferase family protein n=1 Tax=Anaerosporobacter sp. TaxID=1872529 RepID=UPI00286EBAD8|nr:6-hydroxymethylpterin diphosphokinase MptE-like protein [Anaerosporobacter sp.]
MNTLLDINASIIEFIDVSVFYFQQQEYDCGLQQMGDLLNNLEWLLANYELMTPLFEKYDSNLEIENLVQVLGEVSMAQMESDYILVSDLLVLQLRPFISKIQEMIMMEYDSVPSHAREKNLQIIKDVDKTLYNDVTTNKVGHNGMLETQCEFTSSGLATIKCYNEGHEFYLHSNNNPQFEAAIWANSGYKDSKYKYVVYGVGLGYHIIQLCRCNPYIEIEVYESNLEIIKLAIAYGKIGECLESGQVKIFYDPQFTNFSKRIGKIDEDTEVLVHGPSQRLIRNKNIRRKMEAYFLHYNSVRNQSGLLYANYRYNTCNYDASIDTILYKWSAKDIYIVAAGPSLDLNYEYLKKIKNNAIILAIGAVFKKLIKNGIVPDYVIITDGKPIVLNQIEGLYNEKVPLILLTTTNREITENYRGEKYIVCQNEYRLAEEFAKDNGYQLYNTGGCVVTTALDLAIASKAHRIIFVGLDLAYPNNLMYAEEVRKIDLVDSKEFEKVKDIHGNWIKTNKHLNIYRKWIERRIDGIKDIEFIDATEGGAFIEGTRCMRLKETLL